MVIERKRPGSFRAEVTVQGVRRRAGLRRRHRLGDPADGHRAARGAAGRGRERDGRRGRRGRPARRLPGQGLPGHARRPGEAGRRTTPSRSRSGRRAARSSTTSSTPVLVPDGADRGQAHDPGDRDRGREPLGRLPGGRGLPLAVLHPERRQGKSREAGPHRREDRGRPGPRRRALPDAARRRRRSLRGTDARRGVLAGPVAGRPIRIARAPRVCSVCGRRAPAGGPT